MREILFKGQRHDGVWEEGYYFARPILDKHFILCGENQWMVKPETICEFTGKLDRNKNKIFEGDIFHIEDDIFAVVIFMDGSFRLEEYGLQGTYTESGWDECGGGYGVIDCSPIDWYTLIDMEVIGNIHDNPELLSGY